VRARQSGPNEIVSAKVKHNSNMQQLQQQQQQQQQEKRQEKQQEKQQQVSQSPGEWEII